MDASSDVDIGRRRRLRPQCPQCGSRRFRRDPDTSLIVCAHGHVLQGYRQEENDAGEGFTAASGGSQRRARYIRKQKNDRRRKESDFVGLASKEIWHGDRSAYLYFQCLQFVLRLQIEALHAAIPGIPAELEAVCRDLWAFYVSHENALKPQPYIEEALLASGAQRTAGDQNEKSVKERRKTALQRAAQAELTAILEEEMNESQRVDDEMRLMGMSEDDEHSESIRNGIEHASDRSDEDDNDDFDVDAYPQQGRRKRRALLGSSDGRQAPKPGEDAMLALLSILYLALVTLRVPIIWADLRSLVIESRLPYLHAIYHLPPDMTQHLSRPLALRLDASRVPSLNRLSMFTVDFAAQLTLSFDIRFPQINALPVLWRLTQRMLLPPTFYRAAKRLLAYVDVSMSSVVSQSTFSLLEHEHGRESSESHRARSERGLKITLSKSAITKEVVLMAALLIVIKMRYGLDGEDRIEEVDESQCWTCSPSLDVWLRELEQNGDQLAYSHARRLADPNAVELLDVDTDDLDTYLDHVERYFVYDSHPNAFYMRGKRSDVDDMLGAMPMDIPRTNQTVETEAWQSQIDVTRTSLTSLYDGQNSLLPQKDELRPSDLRPGEAYSVYRREGPQRLSPADASLVHPEYACVLRIASRMMDCEPTDISDTVYAMEMHLIHRLSERSAARQEKEKRK